MRREPRQTAPTERTRSPGCTPRSRRRSCAASPACRPGSHPRGGRVRRGRRRGCSTSRGPRTRTRRRVRSTRARPRTRGRRSGRSREGTPPPPGPDPPLRPPSRGRRRGGTPSGPHQEGFALKGSAVRVGVRAFPNDSTIQVVRVKYGHPLGRGPEATAIGTLDTEAFNTSKAMELPRNIVIGHDALLAVGEVCQALKLGKKALIVADENTIKIAR